MQELFYYNNINVSQEYTYIGILYTGDPRLIYIDILIRLVSMET